MRVDGVASVDGFMKHLLSFEPATELPVAAKALIRPNPQAPCSLVHDDKTLAPHTYLLWFQSI